MQLLDLPEEVLELIFQYIPNVELNNIKEIPEIKQYVLYQLYSVVIIGSQLPRTKVSGMYQLKYMFPSTSTGSSFIPRFENNNDLIKFMKENPRIIPKVVFFEYPRDLLNLNESNPEILQNCKIRFLLENIDIENGTFEKLKQLEYPIDKLLAFGSIFDLRYHMENNDWFNRINIIDIHGDVEDIKSCTNQSRFNSLTELTITQLNEDQIKYIPRGVKKLTFTSYFTMNEYLQDLPNYLELLKIRFVTDEGFELCCDVSYLENLKSLMFEEFVGSWNLPSSIKKLELVGCMVSLDNVNEMCPYLTDFFYDSSEIDSKRISYVLQELPTSLTRLSFRVENLQYMVFHNQLKNGLTDELKRQVIDSKLVVDFFPTSLTKLHLYGSPLESYYDESFLLKFDNMIIDLNKLGKLRELWLQCVTEFSQIKNLPQSLNNLILKQTTGVNFKEFKHLENLDSLEISLNRNFQPIALDSTNIKYLKLTCNTIKHVSPSNLILPPSLHELVISNSGVESINSQYVFPHQLQVLSLDFNRLDHLPKLPTYLKTLSLASNKFGSKGLFPVLPKSIEILDISENELTKQSLVKFNLKNCTNLKILNLSGNQNIQCLSLDILPKSLTHLYLYKIGLTEFIGNFGNFPRLEVLVLSHNMLGEFLNKNTPQIMNLFGNGIKEILLDSNGLSQECMESIMSLYSSKQGIQ
ncbi:hypothetical protein K4I79_005644 [Candida tropicalis]